MLSARRFLLVPAFVSLVGAISALPAAAQENKAGPPDRTVTREEWGFDWGLLGLLGLAGLLGLRGRPDRTDYTGPRTTRP